MKAVDKFKEVLEVSLSKKVLYRQSEFADQVDFQNRNNLTYFYTNEGNQPFMQENLINLQGSLGWKRSMKE